MVLSLGSNSMSRPGAPFTILPLPVTEDNEEKLLWLGVVGEE